MLANNERLYMYESSDRESLLMKMRELRRLKKTDPDEMQKQRRLAMANNSRVGKIVFDDYAYRMMDAVLDWEEHFKGSQVTSLRWMEENLQRVSGGVSTRSLSSIDD
jgi:hypothetical protein